MIRLLRISPKRWLYWGKEHDVEQSHFGPIDPFFFIEDVPPYRIGNGWRFKETPIEAWHVGVAVKSNIVTQEGALGGQRLEDITPEQIGEWK